MLIMYRTTTGEVVDNTGTCSGWPAGPPEELAYVNTDPAGIERDTLALLRLDDEHDHDLVQAALRNYSHVDTVTGTLVIEGPFPSLVADRDQIVADNVTTAVLTYESGRAPSEVTFDANGATETVSVADSVAQLEVVADTPGPITVTCQGLTVTITATEAPA